MLERLTVTGADDLVDPAELCAISGDFPFVEWGILFSEKRTNSARYPTADWVHKLVGLDDLNLSAHLCGKMSRDAASGTRRLIEYLRGPFQRFQLNAPGPLSPLFLDYVRRYPRTEFIIQSRYESELQELANKKLAALWDPSGGRGIEAFSYPHAPIGLHLGFAGGVSEGNILTILKYIGPRTEGFWLDGERGFRTDDKFDLRRVVRCLETVAPFVTAHSPLPPGPLGRDG